VAASGRTSSLDAVLAGRDFRLGSRGVFAGLALKGVVIKPEDELNLAVYNKTAEELLKDSVNGDVTPDPGAFPRAIGRYTGQS
jgi:lipid-binding SYLF domain-containing protein